MGMLAPHYFNMYIVVMQNIRPQKHKHLSAGKGTLLTLQSA